MTIAKPLKPKACKACKTLFQPRSSWARACSVLCGLEIARKVSEKKSHAAAVADRKETRERLEAMKTIPQLLREAQVSFNVFIRERDRQAGYPCISSGRPLDWSGNGVDAGHFRSVGAAPHIRYNEDNCHAQSKHDNQYLSGNMGAYRVGLIARIGLERVQALECANFLHKWTREELIEIKRAYMAKLKELKGR